MLPVRSPSPEGGPYAWGARVGCAELGAPTDISCGVPGGSLITRTCADNLNISPNCGLPCQIREAHGPVAQWKSNGLLIRRPRVRIPPGPPALRSLPKPDCLDCCERLGVTAQRAYCASRRTVRPYRPQVTGESAQISARGTSTFSPSSGWRTTHEPLPA